MDSLVSEMVITQRGSSALLVNNFKFIKHKVRQCGKVRWRCDRRKLGCSALCYTQGETTNILEHKLQHNHEPDENKYSVQAISNSCKRKATEQLFEKPEKIMKLELQSSSGKETVTEKDVSKVRRNMWNARRKTLPTLPKNVLETQQALDGMNIETDRGEKFVLENDKESKIVILGSKRNIEMLKECETLLMDGTFDYCCDHFKQMFTVFAVKNGHYIPLLFCLLPDKKETSYEILFEKIRSAMGDHSVTEIMVDFEIGIHNAARKVWSTVTIFGCRFHLTQSWYRKIQKLGLSKIYNTPDKNVPGENEISKWLRGVFGLPFLEPEEVSESFVEDLMPELPIDNRVRQFADYIVETYLEDDVLFPPKVWAAFEKQAVTTNACESFHAHFGKKFYHSHPNVFTFVSELVSFQTFVYVKINSVHQKPRETGGKLYKKRKEELNTAREQYASGAISRKDFVKIASKRFAKS